MTNARLLLGLLSACVLLLSGREVAAQVPAWQLATIIGQGVPSVDRMATDAAGNLYLAGTFTGTARFGSIVLSTAANSGDVYIAKWNPGSNQFLWAKAVTSAGYTTVTNVVVEGNNVYVAGSFDAPVLNCGGTLLTNSGSTSFLTSDVYVLKLTDAGTTASVAWAQQTGGPGNEEVARLVVANGNVYLGGSFDGATMTVGPVVLTRASGFGLNRDVYVAKFRDTGGSSAAVWAWRAGGSAQEAVSSLLVVGSTLYLGGFFTSATADFGTFTLTNQSPSGAYGDLFVARLTDTGPAPAVVWVQTAGGPDNEAVSTLAVVGNHLYVTGGFNGPSLTLGATTLQRVPSTTAFSSDMFVARLTDTGTSADFDWAVAGGSSGDDTARSLVAVGAQLYLVGRYTGPQLQFGPLALSQTGTYASFLAKLTDTGTAGRIEWLQTAAAPAGIFMGQVLMRGTTVYVSGGYSGGTATFDGITLTVPASQATAFVAALADPTLLPAQPATSLAQLAVVPNPAHASATVQLPALPVRPATLTLLDALGRPVRTTSLRLAASATAHPLDLTGLAPGLYLLRLSTGGSTATQRLVVE